MRRPCINQKECQLDEKENEAVERLLSSFKSSLENELLIKVRFVGEDLHEELTFELAPATQFERTSPFHSENAVDLQKKERIDQNSVAILRKVH